MVLVGCRLDVVAATQVDADGSGTVEFQLRLDDALLDELDELAIDPTIEVTALARELEGWGLAREVDDEQAIVLTLQRPFDDPAEVGQALRELTSGLTADDPALVVDIEVLVDDDGRSSVAGSAGFRAPSGVGAQIDDEPLGPSAQELETLVADVVAPAVRITLPGPVTSHDADRLDGRTLTWDLPVGSERELAAAADAPGIYEQPWLWALAAGLVVAVLAAVLFLRRRR